MNVVRALCLAVLVTGCATDAERPTPSADTGTIIGEVGDPRNRARLHTELAALYFDRGSMAVALEELRIAVGADPGYAAAHSMFGLVYMSLRENKSAEESFRRALELAPNDADVNHNYGWFLCQTGRQDASIAFFLKAIRNPLYQRPWQSYAAAGACTLAAGRDKEADDLLKRALELSPDNLLALLQMAHLRYRQTRFGEARENVLRFNRVTVPTPESLWLAIRIERKMGQRTAEASYANQLRRRYPDSSEYQKLQRGDYD